MLTGIGLIVVVCIGVFAGIGKCYEGYYLTKHLTKNIKSKEETHKRSNILSYNKLEDQCK